MGHFMVDAEGGHALKDLLLEPGGASKVFAAGMQLLPEQQLAGA